MKYGMLVVLFALLFITACSGTTSTIGDGQVDEVEAAVLRVAVGAAMSAAPEAVAPAYAVSTALLAKIDGDDFVTLDLLSTNLDSRIAALDLSFAERQSVMDLVSLVKARIKSELKLSDKAEAQKLIVVRQIIQIVRDSSVARLGVGGAGSSMSIPEFRERLEEKVAVNRKQFEANHAAEIEAFKGSSI